MTRIQAKGYILRRLRECSLPISFSSVVEVIRGGIPLSITAHAIRNGKIDGAFVEYCVS